MLLLVDNYDSFTYNVAGLCAELGAQVEVIRNDAATCTELLAHGPDRVILSPGPGGPDDAGVCLELVRAAARTGTPLLGICLGMQCVGQAFGATIERLPNVVHGSASAVSHDGAGVYAGMPGTFDAGRYHSLVVAERTLPAELVATAHTTDGVLMGIRHRSLPIEGVQFHPESILTPRGRDVLAAFLGMTAAPVAAEVA